VTGVSAALALSCARGIHGSAECYLESHPSELVFCVGFDL